MRLFEVSEQEGCPRTKATECSCDRLRQLSEAEQTIEAVAVLGHGDAKGMISFKQAPGKATVISGTITGLSEGLHGFHIHEFGDLSDGCDSAGGHYNPTGVDHGDIDTGHVGDLGNITADSKGVAKFSIKAKRIHLQGATSIVGRAVVVHEGQDDLGKGGDEESLKTGNAGERAGCGVISLTELTESAIADLDKNISNKHFSRSEMPQIKEPDLDAEGISHEKDVISLDKIKPVQTDRVPGLAQKVAKNFHGKDKPFILDKDNYLVNGHHRYDAARLLGIDRVRVLRVNDPRYNTIELLQKKFSHTTSNTVVEDVVDGNFPTQQRDKEMQQGMERELKMHKVLERLAQMWWNNNEDPAVEQKLADMGWEIGEDEGSDTPSVFVVEIGDENGNSYTSWPIEQLENDVVENFADGKKKGKSKPGRVKKAGASCNGSVTALRKRAKNSSGEKAKMYHWCANMKSGKKKTNEDMEDLTPSAKMADEYIKDEIMNGKIKNLNDLKKYILELRLARVIEYAEDARDLWVYHITQNPHKLKNF
jgi:Cu-Zn family superoxide dismutase